MKITDIEKGLSHRKFLFKGSYIYPLIKQELLLSRLSEHREQFPRKKTKTGAKLRSLIAMLSFAPRFLFQKTPGSCKYLFIDSAASRRYHREGISYSVYCDFLMEKLAPECSLLLELPYDIPISQKGRASQNVYYPDLDFVGIFIRSLFTRGRYRETEIMLSELRKFDIDLNAKELNRLLKRFSLYSRWAGRILRKISPEYIFIVSPYSYIRMALVRMARKRGTPVIEMQHGQVSLQHFGYIYKQLENRDLIPDYFFAFGPYYSELLKKHSVLYPPEHIFNTGMLFLAQGSSAEEKAYKNLISLADGRKILLISSQITTREEMKKVSRFLAETLAEKIFVVYKPHPIESDASGFYHELKAFPSFYLVENPELNTLDLLRISDLHMTVYSTVFMEAYYFQVPTLFYYMEGLSANIMEFVDNKGYYLIRNRDELLTTLEPFLASGKMNTEMDSQMGFYQSDPWGSFCSAMEAIGDI